MAKYKGTGIVTMFDAQNAKETYQRWAIHLRDCPG